MNHLHALLAAADLSAPAHHAAMRAAMLASESGARLELLHVGEERAERPAEVVRQGRQDIGRM